MDGGAGGLAGKLATAGHRACPTKELSVSKTVFPQARALVAVRVGAVAAQTLPAAVVAGFAGSLTGARHDQQTSSRSRDSNGGGGNARVGLLRRGPMLCEVRCKTLLDRSARSAETPRSAQRVSMPGSKQLSTDWAAQLPDYCTKRAG